MFRYAISEQAHKIFLDREFYEDETKIKTTENTRKAARSINNYYMCGSYNSYCSLFERV